MFVYELLVYYIWIKIIRQVEIYIGRQVRRSSHLTLIFPINNKNLNKTIFSHIKHIKKTLDNYGKITRKVHLPCLCKADQL